MSREAARAIEGKPVGSQILITGGAGFIGSHLADRLLELGHRVRVLDNLSPQIHGVLARRPAYLSPDAELVVGDVRDRGAVLRAVQGADAVFHLAAAVGVGQSMYEVERYTSINNTGTAVLLECLIKKPVEKLVVASSMSVYGEGLCVDGHGRISASAERTLAQLRAKQWEVRSEAGEPLSPIATTERKPPALSSVYALSKFDQERLCLMMGRTYGLPTVALRFFNVYGSRQALSNPYTGVLAIFAARLLNDKAPLINEDGLQRRDFISVHDVVQSCILALESGAAEGRVFNIGSGRPRTILEVAEKMALALGKQGIRPEVTGIYRAGDIRHCFADIALAREVLGFSPEVELEPGLVELAEWLGGQTADDRVEEARAELEDRGLTA